MITLLVAAAEGGVIGDKGAIPWHIPGDLKRFKALTMGHPVIMGRKTWDSLPRRPLPGRTNIVISRRPGWQDEGAQAAASLEQALALAGGAAGGQDSFVIGGGEIYRAALAHAGRIALTEVKGVFAGDTVFAFDRALWREEAREEHVGPDGLGYAFVSLIRK